MKKKAYVDAASASQESRPFPNPVDIKLFGDTITETDVRERVSWSKYSFTEHFDTFADVEDCAFVMFKITAHRDNTSDEPSKYYYSVSSTFGEQAFAIETAEEIIDRVLKSGRWTDVPTADRIVSKIKDKECCETGSEVGGIENVYFTYWI